MPAKKVIRPRSIRLDASTACQLKCRSCPTATGETGKWLGTGFLRLRDFKRLVDENPRVSCIELSNWGEIFLNPELLEIMAYAYKRNVALFASNGVNLNDVDEAVLEGLVKYRFQGLSCSIDGTNQETYSTYRVRGDFDRVINNIKTINQYKAKYRSRYPKLQWQFVTFGHNEHEIEQARKMARDLDMKFHVKLNWEDLYTDSFSPVMNADLVGMETGLGVATRGAYKEKYGRDYVVRHCCLDLWDIPQINYDGRVLGCSINFQGDYGIAFKEGLTKSLNNDKINHAREMLMGRREARPDIPCAQCKVYTAIKESGDWIREKETGGNQSKSRTFIMLENKILGYTATNALAGITSNARRFMRKGRSLARRAGAKPGFVCLKLAASVCARSGTQLKSGVHPLEIPLAPDDEKGWKPYPVFHGATLGMHELSCHASVLSPGRCPHRPHAHEEEEFLLLLTGEVDLLLAGDRGAEEIQRRRLRPGQFVYYPANFAHTLETAGEAPASYMMFKWRARGGKTNNALTFGMFDMLTSAGDSKAEDDYSTRFVFEGATDYLKRLQCHTSVLPPGKGYAAHVDDYDVAAVVLEGEVETLGRRVGPCGVIFYAAGKPHGMSNPGTDTAKYIVFEYQGRKAMYVRRLVKVLLSFLRKLTGSRRR